MTLEFPFVNSYDEIVVGYKTEEYFQILSVFSRKKLCYKL